jgi:hypothetical protein
MTFLTIREAAERTGHSTHKIRRLIKSIAEQPTHSDRGDVEPSAADVARLDAQGVQFTWRVAEELVRRKLGDVPTSIAAGGSRGGESGDLFSLAQRALAAQEAATSHLVEQLRVKDEQIAALNDRLRESNVLMASLQKQLPEPKKVIAGAATTDKPRPQQGSGKAKKKGWLRIFS